jgi:pimeloyl-ACP methyl ester carboxylesterase
MLRLRGSRREVELTAEQMSRLRVPVQLVWGETDPFGSPEVGRRAAEVIPGAELHVVPGGHAPWLRQAERIAELVAPFLRRHASVAT